MCEEVNQDCSNCVERRNLVLRACRLGTSTSSSSGGHRPKPCFQSVFRAVGSVDGRMKSTFAASILTLPSYKSHCWIALIHLSKHWPSSKFELSHISIMLMAEPYSSSVTAVDKDESQAIPTSEPSSQRMPKVQIASNVSLQNH